MTRNTSINTVKIMLTVSVGDKTYATGAPP